MKDYKQIANTLRKDIIMMTHEAKSGHPGGSLSACEILTALYFKEMRIDPSNPKWEDRDRFVLSKGHATPVLYATLSERGFFPKEELMKFRKINSMLQGHPDMKGTPGVDMSTGSLGQGLAVANGMALSAKLDNKDYRVYALVGDGEIQEGIIWEAAMFATHYKLDNLTVFMDHNGLQIDGHNEDVMNVEPVNKKFEAFGWNVLEIDGHDFNQIFDALEKSKAIKDKPTLIIAKTVKGKGVSFMENQANWHGTAPNAEQAQKAFAELGGEL
ncbi:transketolase [Proteiniborus sp. DW1]|nr:transketolase [Proteiniborus sp. DW1]SCG83903.1 transketolase [Proteiniborus sp. DW1]